MFPNDINRTLGSKNCTQFAADVLRAGKVNFRPNDKYLSPNDFLKYGNGLSYVGYGHE